MPEPQPVAPAVPASDRAQGGHGFGTAPVFLASISTILGAVLFLRFGYSVAHAGVLGTLAIVVLGHAVTLPTALAIAEIATNRRVEGGGESSRARSAPRSARRSGSRPTCRRRSPSPSA